MALIAIGPVIISHGDPAFGIAANPVDGESLSIGGSCSWAAAHTLREIMANRSARVTREGHTGIQEWLEFDDDLLGDLTGNYILEGFTISAAQQASLTDDDVPFTLTAMRLRTS